MPINDKFSFAAEIGLSGEVRPVNRCEQRIQEAEKLGFESIFISKYNKIKASDYNIRVLQFGKIEEVFRALFAS
jgi:DNA repair protein RadA/Sms